MSSIVAEHIKNKTFSKIYILFGEEEYMKNYYAKQIVKLCVDDEFSEFNYVKMISDINFDTLENFVNSPPLFSDKKVVEIKNTGIFKSSKPSDKERLSSIFENLSDEVILIFNESEVDKRGALYKYVSKKGVCEVFNYRKTADLKSWAQRLISSRDIKISDSDLMYFLSLCPPSMNEILSELTKLMYYKKDEGVILKQDIEQSVCKTVENKVFEMIDKAICKKTEEALLMFNDLKTLSEPPERILANISAEYMKIRKTKLLSNKYIRNEIASMIKIPPFFAAGYIEKSKKIPMQKINDMIELCRHTDYLMKNSLADKYAALERIIIQSQF